MLNPERVVFVHGSGSSGAAAWPKQHGLSLRFDCLYVRRHGFSATEEPLPTDHGRDQEIIADALGDGGHIVAHSQGAVAAMMLAVERPDLVRTLTLVEPACLSLTADLPATAAHIELMAPLFLQSPPWEAPLSIVPGVPTLVLTGGWEPLYEEVAQYLAGTGAIHRVTAGGHRPHDTPEGDAYLRAFLHAAREGTAA